MTLSIVLSLFVISPKLTSLLTTLQAKNKINVQSDDLSVYFNSTNDLLVTTFQVTTSNDFK